MTPSDEMTARETLTRVGIRKPMAEAVSSIADAIAQARREALEEAARVVEHQIGWTGQIPPDEQRQIAAAIRARVK